MIRTLILILFCFSILFSNAQGAWLQKANFGGNSRREATGFSVGNKGYICCGYDGVMLVLRSDVWEYDPAVDTWTQKANVGGGGRSGAVGFSIGSKGYVGTGAGTAGLKQDFWEYDPVANTWIQKANFGGGNRNRAVGLGIGTKGYVGTGSTGVIGSQDWWEYDPSTNTWTQKNNLGWPYWGSSKVGAVAWALNSLAYVGLGYDQSNNTTDLHEYNPTTNSWVQKAYCPIPNEQSVSFSINNRGYFTTGFTASSLTTACWEYNPVSNTWVQMASFIGSARTTAAGFSIGGSGYVGTGTSGSPPYYKDFFEFNPTGITSADEQVISQSIFAYPNPGMGVFFLSYLPPGAEIKIYSSSGEEVLFTAGENLLDGISLQEGSKGVFLISIISPGHKYYTRIVLI